MKKKPRRSALYIRVSTQEQKTEGYGLENQRQRLLSHVYDNVALNLTTNEDSIYEDVHTGSDRNRIELRRLIQDVRAGKYDVVIVWKIDRLSRSLKDLLEIFEELQKHKVSFISVEESIDFSGPIGNLIFQIFGAIAQFERELIKNRTHAGKLQSALLGNYTGTSIPFGYRAIKNPSGRGKKLEIIQEEKRWVEKVYHWYIYEDLGYIQIAKKLNQLLVSRGEHNTKRERSKKWTGNHIKTIITQTLYRGEFVANNKGNDGENLPQSEWTIAAVPPCISETTFRIAQRKRETRKGATVSDHVYLLTGKIYDMNLDTPIKFIGKPRTKGGRSYRRKKVTDSDGQQYGVFEVPAKVLEDETWRKVREALESPEIFINQHLNKDLVSTSRIEDLEQELSALREANMNLELTRVRIQDAYEKGIYTTKSLEDRMRMNETEKTNNELRINQIEDELNLVTFHTKEVESLRQAAKEVNYRLDNLTRKQQKILIDIFVDRVEMRRKEMPSTTKRKKWETTATVVFRFNPRFFATPKLVGRTEDLVEEQLKVALESKRGKHGRNPHCGQNLFSYPFLLRIQSIPKKNSGITNTVTRIVAMPISSMRSYPIAS